VQQQICARSVKCLLCHHHPCMVRAATMLVGEGAVEGPLGGVWSERRVSCVLAAADVLATGTEWRQTTHQSRKKRSIGSQEGTIILDLPFGFPINNIISARKRGRVDVWGGNLTCHPSQKERTKERMCHQHYLRRIDECRSQIICQLWFLYFNSRIRKSFVW